MERISIFDIYKIGVGPSSSHTLGPWKAALRFAQRLPEQPFDRLEVHLFGSLSKTGRGHATDTAVLLGLEGFAPETIDTSTIAAHLQRIRAERQLYIHHQAVAFDPATHIVFEPYALPFHPNALTFRAFYLGALALEATYYSVGGGFILGEGEESGTAESIVLPYPIDRGSDLLRYTQETGEPIWRIVYQNEQYFRSEAAIREKLSDIFRAMLACVFRGCTTEGTLPGGLQIKRRAHAISRQLLDESYTDIDAWLATIKGSHPNFTRITKWVSCFALAVNEENAALGRIVTSPTNGAAGVIPAVLLYYYCFCDDQGEEDLLKFMLTSGEVGCLFKKGATISAAQGGCQAEVGVSSAMAAAGLTEVLGGTAEQVLMAAEIAMEHHLGLTCDPIGGLVQVPCIERNAMGAMKAITASNLALCGKPEDAVVQFDVVVKTMWETAQDMSEKYKETAEGGLAFHLPVTLPNC